jgi:hypothetical protein
MMLLTLALFRHADAEEAAKGAQIRRREVEQGGDGLAVDQHGAPSFISV